MSTAPRYLPRYTVEDYQSWQGDWELWDGIAVSMSPSPFGPHKKLAGRLYTALQVSIDTAECNAAALYEIDWIVSNNTVVRPDLLVLCGDAPSRHVQQVPAVVAEILSPSTEGRDRHEKLELYQEEQVPHYFILDADQQSFEWFQLDSHGVYRRQPVDQSVSITICKDCRLEIDIAKLFA